MRPVLPNDLDRCARALMVLEEGARSDHMLQLLSAADLADRYRKRTGRMHPVHGDGSLGVAAWRAGLGTRPDRCDIAYCLCLSIVLEKLHFWRQERGAHATLHAL